VQNEKQGNIGAQERLKIEIKDYHSLKNKTGLNINLGYIFTC
jgi:hypothetical protein